MDAYTVRKEAVATIILSTLRNHKLLAAAEDVLELVKSKIADEKVGM